MTRASATRVAKPLPTIFLRVDFELTAEQREIKAVARDFAEAEIEPFAAEWDREHRFPRDLFPSWPSSG